MTRMPCEQTVVRRALAGDHDAFELLLRAYARSVYCQAYALLHNRHDSEDIVQETFFKAFRHRDRLDNPAKFKPWLMTIARNTARDRLRRRASRLSLLESLDEPQPKRASTPDRQLAERESRGEVLEAVAALPDRYREVIELRYIQGLAYRGIQQRLGISDGALRGRLGRALGRLRRALDRRRIGGPENP